MMPAKNTQPCPTEIDRLNYSIMKDAMISSCLMKCAKREKNYAENGEICAAKCYDLLLKYIALGSIEIRANITPYYLDYIVRF